MAELKEVGTYLETKETVYALLPADIVVREDRHRQKFNRKPLDALIDSMREVGQLQPGICHKNGAEEIELIIGERRLRCCTFLGLEFQFLLKENIKDPLILEQMQLDENLVREDLAWQEEVLAKARLHTILTERYGATKPGVKGGHGLKDTAEYLGSKLTSLHEDVTLASFLQVPEVMACLNKTTAKKVAKRLIQQVKREESLQEALGSIKEKEVTLSEQERSELKLKALEKQNELVAKGMGVAEAKIEAREVMEKEKANLKKEKEISPTEQRLVYFSKRAILGSMEEKLASFPDNHFDLICFDPPWGVEFDSVRKPSPGTKEYEDSWERFWAGLKNWLTFIYSKMKEDSHLYMFFGIVAHGFVYDTLEAVGFSTNRMPLIWHKMGAHVTRNPTIWPGRSYEPIAYARKGKKPLVKMGAPDVISTPQPTPSIKDIHPSAKHPQIYRELISRSASPGEVILDPMAGSGMFGVAAESLEKTHALNWYMIEKDSDYRNLQLLNLNKGYDEIIGEKERVEIEIKGKEGRDKYKPPTSFKGLTPGTPEWGEYFKNNPEEQDAMLAWRMELKK